MENLEPIHAAIAGGVLILLLLGIRLTRRGNTDAAYLTQVRAFVSRGDFRRAGEIQFKHNQYREAYNLFERGEVHGRASQAAERLGEFESAAHHAESNGDLDRAARMFRKANKHSNASEVLERAGKFEQAATCLEKAPGASASDLARLWENAFLSAVPPDQSELDAATAAKLLSMAEKAAEGYKRSGNMERASHFYDLANQEDRARHIRAALPRGSFVDDSDQPQPAAQAELKSRLKTALGNATSGSFSEQRSSDANTVGPRGEPTRLAGPGSETLRDPSLGRDETIADPRQGALLEVADTRANSNTAASTQQPTVRRHGARPDSASANALDVVQQEVLSHHNPSPESNVVHEVHRVERQARGLTQEVDHVSRIEVVHRVISESGGGTHRTAPEVDDRYELHEKLGEGGMGVVYRAFDRVLEREIALKFLPADVTASSRLTEMFEQEAKTAAALNHPNIVTVHDFGVMNGQPFMCMELVPGQTAAGLLAAFPSGLPLAQLLAVGEGLMAALAFAHKQKTVHRDVKPANIMINTEGLVKLMDFGIARLAESDKTTKIAGTPAYMSPEQMTGKGVGASADVFAAGATLYELTTGTLPFEGLRRDGVPTPVSELNPYVPAKLAKSILRCLSYDPRKRLTSAKLHRLFHGLRRRFENTKSSPPDPIIADSADRAPLPREARASSGPYQLGEHQSAEIRSILAEFPHESQPTNSQKLIRDALQDPRPSVRAAAIELLPGNVTDTGLHRILTAFLDDDDEHVRMAVLARAQDAVEQSLLDTLHHRIENEDLRQMTDRERRALVRSIVDVGQREAKPILEHVLSQIDGQTGYEGSVADVLEGLSLLESGPRETVVHGRHHRPSGYSENLALAEAPPAHRSQDGELSVAVMPDGLEDLLRDYLDK